MSNILVTGAGGYLGSVLVGQLLQDGHDVIAYDCFFFGQDILDNHTNNPRLELRQKDVRDIEAADLDGVDVVFDLAAISNDPSGALDPNMTRTINHEGRARVARTAKAVGVKRYILASSCSVYGSSDGTASTEKSALNPLTVYAECNYRAEDSNLTLGDEQFCVSALRFSTLFGLSRRMRFDLVINYMSLTAITRKKIEITGGGKQWRPLVHVSDAARALRTVMQADPSKVNGEVFNIGYTNLQIDQLAQIVKESVGAAVEIILQPGSTDKRDYLVDFSKAEQILGFKAQVSPQQGVAEITAVLRDGSLIASPRTNTVDWYRYLLSNQKAA